MTARLGTSTLEETRTQRFIDIANRACLSLYGITPRIRVAGVAMTRSTCRTFLLGGLTLRS